MGFESSVCIIFLLAGSTSRTPSIQRLASPSAYSFFVNATRELLFIANMPSFSSAFLRLSAIYVLLLSLLVSTARGQVIESALSATNVDQQVRAPVSIEPPFSGKCPCRCASPTRGKKRRRFWRRCRRRGKPCMISLCLPGNPGNGLPDVAPKYPFDIACCDSPILVSP